ncbi:MAG: ribonuclease J [Bacilli bacterium]|nr:ribonuclease J [Bacilli bacterium]
MSKIKIFALGGLNEIGKNMYVVDVDNDLFVFDAGLKYSGDNMLGVDYIIPNYDYLKENKDRIKGLFITHGHDEQMGAIPDIMIDYPEIPIYATTFTLEIIKRELDEEKIKYHNLHEIKAHHKINFGKCSIFPISVTHSVPDAVAYALYTPDGVIFYTGNYIFDPTMTNHYKMDVGKIAYVGKQGVLCVLGESLYADKVGYTSPNHRISDIINETINKAEGRILFNVFQTQLFRIQELLNELKNTEHKVIIMGKLLEKTILKAISMGYMDFDLNRIGDIHDIHEPNVVVIISDEREKPFTNLARIVKGYDKFIKLNETDTILLASRVYDGMEKSAARMYDEIAKTDANMVIIPNKKLSHHASSEDILLMLDLTNPKYYMPVAGEYRHLAKNADLATKAGISEENIIVKLNGQVAEFKDGVLLDTATKIKTDSILIDGKTIGDIGELVIKDRELLGESGVVVVIATLDKTSKQILAGPEILTRGFIYVKDSAEMIKESARISMEVIDENRKPNFIDYSKVKNGIRDRLGKYFYQETECKPMILVVIQEV